jgi:uncharacterized tellurite resistance protein B-like protein
MNYQTILTNLYFLLIHADGKINDQEMVLGNQMVSREGINPHEFRAQMVLLKSKETSRIYAESVMALKKQDRERQIRCVAWLSLVANGDGFMDRAEWQFIYAIYHKELRLPLDEILSKQKELDRGPQQLAVIPLQVPIL